MADDRGIMTKEHAKAIKDSGHGGEPYRPSNGTEGDYFHTAWCADCKKNKRDGCLIELKALTYAIGEKQYPKQWIYDEGGQPACTAFVERGRRFRPPMKGDKPCS